MTIDPKQNPTVPTRGTNDPTRPEPGKGDPDRPIPNPNPPSPPKGDGNTGGGDGPHYTPWLLVRYQPGDNGSRPLAPGSVFWESPDVWTQGSAGINQPVPGEPTKVFARIGNLGMQDATGVTVKYWWANPSIAISEATAHLIATDTVSIPAGNTLVFQSPADWVPVVENAGHECLLVEAYIPVFDPLVSPMDPVDDRHVGQKNEQLVIAQQGQMFHIQLNAHNFTRTEQQVVVEARRALIPRNFAHKFAGRHEWAGPLLDPTLALPVQIAVGREPLRVVPSARLLAAPLAAAVGGGCLPAPDAGATQVFRPGEVRTVNITGALPPSAVRGEVYVTRVTQRIGNVITGGYTIYVTAA